MLGDESEQAFPDLRLCLYLRKSIVDEFQSGLTRHKSLLVKTLSDLQILQQLRSVPLRVVSLTVHVAQQTVEVLERKPNHTKLITALHTTLKHILDA